MHHGIDATVAKRGLKSLAIRQLALDQGDGGDRPAMAAAEIVVDADFMAETGEQLHSVRADVAGATGDENGHGGEGSGIGGQGSGLAPLCLAGSLRPTDQTRTGDLRAFRSPSPSFR